MKLLLALMAIVAFSQGDEWDKANREMVRLAPSRFKELPKPLVQELERRRCTIPQAWSAREPHNVVRGEFVKKGQIDWAVLWSQNMVSSILVFAGGSPADPIKLAEGPDRNILQVVAPGQIGYSRMISPAGSKYILDHYRAHGGPKPP